MSNLVTPMLTSVENSPTLDFYPNLRFSNNPCAIINKGNDQLCLSDTTEWNDLEHLVSRSLFKRTSPSKVYSVSHNRRIFSNNSSLSNDSARVHEQLPCISSQDSNVINNLRNVVGNEINSCTKACVNVNMGFNEGSSIEFMVSNKNPKFKPPFSLSKNTVEIHNTKSEEPTMVQTTVSNTDKIFVPLTAEAIKDNCQIKTFKNGSKIGHSRQWGSCGSAMTLQLNFDDKNIRSKLSLDLHPLNTVHASPADIVSPPPPPPPLTTDTMNMSTTTTTTTTSTMTEVRNTSFNQNNKLKRISQLSFEAEFDSEGRTHEQITIEFRNYHPHIMAGQITQIELSYFKAIKSEEFLSFKWTGLSKHIHAPGIVASTRWFNQLNYWAQRIILDCTELNRRSEMLTYVIRIIKKLVDCYNNLSSGMALMSALEVECIHRLKQTWNTLSNKDRTIFRRMEELFSSENNYEKLREHINSLKLPCIPYLGLYLTDLTYINIAHSKLSEFESQTKTDQINNILRTVSEFQQSNYELSPCPILSRYLESQRYIEELQKLIEDSNYRSSMSLEPSNVDTSCQQTRQHQQQHQQQQQQQQQQQLDFPNFTSLSPQKTPPSYACKHLPDMSSLQSPISPKPMSSAAHTESMNEVTEHHGDQQPTLTINITHNKDGPINIVSGPMIVQLTGTTESVIGKSTLDNDKEAVYEESLMMSSRYSDEDSVRASLLCGTGRKSYFKKRSNSTSIRFKRDSSSSSRQQLSSKTGTLSSTSQSAMSEKDLLSQQHSKSLLDDSYLDMTLNETCTGPVTIDGTGHSIGIGEVSLLPNKPNEVMCSPPIFKCFINDDVVDLKPKASAKRKIEYSNLVKIAHAAETALRFSKINTLSYHNDSGNALESILVDESSNPRNMDSINLIIQGVLSRKTCVKNAKRSRFSMWTRHWIMLIKSKHNAFLVFFENSQSRALERKDFKYKKCHVQDLKSVIASPVRPSLDKNIFEQNPNLSQSSGEDNDISGHLTKFFLIDKEYGTVYKFRDPSCKSRSCQKERKVATCEPDNEQCISSSPASVTQMPSVFVWYRLLKRTINTINSPTDNNKDLIVLSE